MTRRGAMKLRNRLTLTFTLVTAAALVASFLVTYLLVERDELRELDRALLVQAEHTASLALMRGTDDPQALEGPGEAPEPPSLTVRYAAVYDRGGALKANTKSFEKAPRSLVELGLAPDTPLAAAPVDLSVRGAHLRGVLLPMGERRLLLYALSRAGVDSDLSFLVRVFSGLLVAATFVTWIVARWLGLLLSRDVDTIGTVAEAVAAGDLSARVGGRASGTVETHKLAEGLDEMISRLGELVRSQRVFISSAAHELRSPLTSLRGELELALRRERSVEEYKETIGRALADGVALVALADDLLALARVDDRKSASKDQVVLVRDVVDDAKRMARGNAESRRVRLVEHTDCDVARVAVPRHDGARALRNLLDNAISHSPEGSAIAVNAERNGSAVRIVVEDEGPGVSVEDEPLIFAPFYRGATERAGEGSGAGLGLSLAREIARAHGGDIALDRAYTKGARFVLTLPLATAD
jgi:two-component system heavy metal sensor histidine kinase CusS